MLDRTNPIMGIAASDELLQRGCVNLIRLDEIKAQVGPRWDKIKASVAAKLENLLRQKLSPTDFYTQTDDATFLVSMPTATPQESQIFCLRLAHELHISLLGPCDIGKLRLSSVTGARDGECISAPVSGPALVTLAKIARLGEGGGDDAQGPEAASGVEAGTKRVFSHKFTPIWDAQQEAVTAYRCMSAKPDSNNGAGQIAQVKLDLAVTISRIIRAAEVLGSHLETGGRFLMWIPIAFDVLTSPVGRMEIAGVCHNLPSALRPYLIFEVSDLPFGVPQSRLSELVSALRPFCRGVAAHLPVPARIPDFGAFPGAGLQAIGLSFPPSGVGGTEMNNELFKLSHAAKKQRIKSFVFDVPDHGLLRSLRDLSISHISSPLVGEALDTPMPIKRLLMRDIPMTRRSTGVVA